MTGRRFIRHSFQADEAPSGRRLSVANSRGLADPALADDDGTPLNHTKLHQTCCDARFARVVLGPNGELLDLGRTTRDVSPAQRKALHLLDGGCRAGNCNKPAHATDAHHVRFWRFGGRTDLNNLVLLCNYHHYLIHILGWTLDMDPGRVVTLTSPDGLRSYTSHPRGPTQLAM